MSPLCSSDVAPAYQLKVTVAHAGVAQPYNVVHFSSWTLCMQVSIFMPLKYDQINQYLQLLQCLAALNL